MANPEADQTNALSEVFEVLSHPFRRRILIRLHGRNPRDEAEFSADAMADDADEADSLPIELHHRHLPKLADAGFLDWDQSESVVTRGPRFEEIAPLIELMNDHREELPPGWP